jgi:hypothetical protein
MSCGRLEPGRGIHLHSTRTPRSRQSFLRKPVEKPNTALQRLWIAEYYGRVLVPGDSIGFHLNRLSAFALPSYMVLFAMPIR